MNNTQSPSSQIVNTIIDQITKTISTDDNQNKLKSIVIDPILLYLKDRIKYFYIIICLVIVLIFIINVITIIYIFKLYNVIKITKHITNH